MNRRLAAILMADVVGYSGLIDADEAGTLALLKERRTSILDPTVRAHAGRVVKVMGDGVLIEFGSAVNAVAAAVELQRKMAEANIKLPDNNRIVLRIGINLGDVISEGGDILGDGVNIAARLEALAEPGSTCISETIYQQVVKKLDLNYIDLGPQSLKNIPEPVRAFRIASAFPPEKRKTPDRKEGRPSIAVLPFTNLSGDQEQQYLSDGITEDIITELSRFPSLLVIARNSSFQFRGATTDLVEVQRKLGVKYVVEGSLRKLGDHVRITAQLIDAATGNHLWAERYDRDLRDIFTVQDQVVAAIAITVEGRLAARGAEETRRKPTADWGAYDYVLRGREYLTSHIEADAVPYFEHAVELDPNYTQAHAHHAVSLVGRYWRDRAAETLQQALTAAERAMSLDSNNAWSQHAMGFVLMYSRQHSRAGIHFERAHKLNPVDSGVIGDRASWFKFGGRPEEAVHLLDGAMVRDPSPPTWFWRVRGSALFDLQRYPEAISAFHHIPGGGSIVHSFLAAAYAMAGDMDNAHRQSVLTLSADSAFSVKGVGSYLPYVDQAALDRYLNAMRMAGLPE
jgi:adenylate cyclase